MNKNEFNRFGNISAYDVERTVKILEKIASIVITSMGPDGDPSLIQFTSENNVGTPLDGVRPTKDGYTILSSFRTIEKDIQAIVNTSFETTKLNNDSSGDGTTTAYVFFAKCFVEMYNLVYKEFCKKKHPLMKRRVTSGQFSKHIKELATMIIHAVYDNHAITINDYDKLLDVALISLNHDDTMLEPIKALLKDLDAKGIPARNVNINITRSGVSDKTTHSISNGFLISGRLHLRPAGLSELKNARILYLGNSIRTMDSVQGVVAFMYATLDYSIKTKEKFLIVADSIADDNMILFFEKFYANLEITDEDRHVFITDIQNRRGIESGDYIEDMGIYFGSSIGPYTLESSTFKAQVDAILLHVEDEAIKSGKTPEDARKESLKFYDETTQDTQESRVKCIKEVIFKTGFNALPLVDVDNANDMSWLSVKHASQATAKSNTPFLLAHINNLQNFLRETKSLVKKQNTMYRLDNLVQSFATIDIGGRTQSEGDALFSASLDAVKAINSAAKKGVVSGMMIPTYLEAKRIHDESVIQNNTILAEMCTAVMNASRYIGAGIMTNAGMGEDEINEVYNKFWEYYISTENNVKMQPTAFDVLNYEYSDRIISPFESEAAYLTGLIVINTFMTPALFIHPDELHAAMAEQQTSDIK